MTVASAPASAARGRPATRVDHARAAFVVFHVVAVVLLAFPAPSGGMDRRLWKEPTVKAELVGWHDRFAAVGYAGSQEAFEDDLFAVAQGFMKAREAVLAPFKPYHLYCGTWQSWRMFVAPHTSPTRLEISVLEGETWRPVFVERSDEHTWRRSLFDQDRMRSVLFRYAWTNYNPSWKMLATWVAKAAAVDFPEASKVKVEYTRQTSPTPEQARAGEEPPRRSALKIIKDLEPLR